MEDAMLFANEIMTKNVVTVRPDTDVSEIANLLIEGRFSAVPVVEADGSLVGIVSEGDLVHRVLGDHDIPRNWWLKLIGDASDVPREYVRSHGSTATDVMTPNIITVTEFTSIVKIAEILEARNIKRVPVVRAEKLVGIVSRADVIWALVVKRDQVYPLVTASDNQIRDDIWNECRDHAWGKDASLDINVANGIVRFQGCVDSQDTKDALRVAAENVPGVKFVEEDLRISAALPSHI